MPSVPTDSLLLLMDTCGDRGSLALMRGDVVLHEAALPERMASAAILPAVRALLRSADIKLCALDGLGVTNGPGSFTGLRVGLAVAKGLAEAAMLPLAAVSRLAVLAHASGVKDGFAILRAGRGQLYVREMHGRGEGSESLMEESAFLRLASHRKVAFSEESLGPDLQKVAAQAHCVAIRASDALPLVRLSLENGGSVLADVDANYVRDEGAIYARPQVR